MDAALSQVDWNSAAKKPGEGLTARARELREESRRLMLVSFAPTMVLNEWAGSDAGKSAPPVTPLPDLHPLTALGVVQWAEETTPFPHEWWLTIWRVMPSIKASAAS